MPPQSPEDARWFAAEVEPHEPILRAYLHKQFPTLEDVDDVVQESYLRLLKAKAAGTLRSARGFIFTAARNIVLDGFRRRKNISLEAVVEFDELAVLEDRLGVIETVSRNQELDLLAEAIESLPQRCRQVLKLRKIYGLSHKEIAQQLCIAERTVAVQVGKGVQRCLEYMQTRGATGLADGSSLRPDATLNHGAAQPEN